MRDWGANVGEGQREREKSAWSPKDVASSRKHFLEEQRRSMLNIAQD